jgi:tRNA(adenine34) deaminase
MTRLARHEQWMRRAIAAASAVVPRVAASAVVPRAAAAPAVTSPAAASAAAPPPATFVDVPVGAVVFAADGTELASARNEREARDDPTAHAEILALRAAAARLGSWRLDGCVLVVTLEPCTMCAGALVLARIAALVFGAFEPKTGAVGSLWDVVRDPRLNHRPEVYGGVLQEQCAALLVDFFSVRRD